MALPKLNLNTYTTELSNGDIVEFRPYVVKEEKQILIARETGTEADMVRATRNLVRECTFGNIEVDSLPTFDFEKLFLLIRAKSAGELSELLITCSECDSQTKVDINVEEAYLSGELKDSKDMTVELTDTVGVQLRYPKIGNLVSGGQQADDIMKTIANCIELIYDEEKVYMSNEIKSSELIDFIESLNTKQFTSIANILGDMPKLVIDNEFDCSSCGFHNELKLEGIANFF